MHARSIRTYLTTKGTTINAVYEIEGLPRELFTGTPEEQSEKIYRFTYQFGLNLHGKMTYVKLTKQPTEEKNCTQLISQCPDSPLAVMVHYILGRSINTKQDIRPACNTNDLVPTLHAAIDKYHKDVKKTPYYNRSSMNKIIKFESVGDEIQKINITLVAKRPGDLRHLLQSLRSFIGHSDLPKDTDVPDLEERPYLQDHTWYRLTLPRFQEIEPTFAYLILMSIQNNYVIACEDAGGVTNAMRAELKAHFGKKNNEVYTTRDLANFIVQAAENGWWVQTQAQQSASTTLEEVTYTKVQRTEASR